jgi:ATP-dependent DNA helicase RecG
VATQRLDILRKSEDGFEIAEKDSGPAGRRRSAGVETEWLPGLSVRGSRGRTADLIAVAADDARLILARDSGLTSPNAAGRCGSCRSCSTGGPDRPCMTLGET